MILEQPEFDGHELETIAGEVRNNVHPSHEKQLLPQNYNPLISWQRQLKDIPVGIESAMESITDLGDVLPEQHEQSEKYDTGVIDSFNRLLLDAQKDINSIYRPTWTNSLKMNNIIRDSIDEYYKFRMTRYVQQVYQHIQVLITFDNFPASNFGDYKSLVKAFESSNSDVERQRHLDELILIGLSNIPFELKQAKKKSITPMLSSSIKTQ
jgi:hypothetical protein